MLKKISTAFIGAVLVLAITASLFPSKALIVTSYLLRTNNGADILDTAAFRSNLGAAKSGAATASGLTISTARLLGRTTASTGALEEISVSGCTLSGGTLTCTGTGTVTSAALALPSSILTVSGSPVTSSGTLTGTLVTQTANTVWAGPTTGSAATPTFRSLVIADLPTSIPNANLANFSITLNSHALSLGGSLALAFSDFAGTVASGQLPNPSASSLGGIESLASVSHKWINQISTSGVPSATQPAFSDLSGAVTAAQLPLPGSASLGGVFSKAAVTHNFLTSISSVDGSIGQAQPAFTDISGTLAGLQLPTISGDCTNSSAALTCTKSGGVAFGSNAFTSTAYAATIEADITPAVTFAGGNSGITYSTAAAHYISNGGEVMVSFFIVLSSKGTSTGQLSLILTGAPTIKNITANDGSGCYLNYYSSTTLLTGDPTANADNGTVQFDFYQFSASGKTAVSDTNITNSTQIRGVCHYFK